MNTFPLSSAADSLLLLAQSSSLEVQESPQGASSVQETLWPKYTPPSYRDQAKGMTLYIDHLLEDRTVTDRKVSEGIFRASNHHSK